MVTVPSRRHAASTVTEAFMLNVQALMPHAAGTNDQASTLSVILPLHDEASNIEPLLHDIDAALKDRIAFEIVCVNDGSRDATAVVLRQAQQGRPHLRVISHTRTCGQSAALRTGVRAARSGWIALLDGDGQNDPADIPRLLAAFSDPQAPASLQLVMGNRRGQRRDTWMKRMSSVFANTLRARLLGDETPDTGCGLKIMLRSNFLTLPDFDHMHRFIPALIQRQGGTVMSLPVHHRPRAHGQSHYGTWDRLAAGVVDLIGVLWLMRRTQRPVVLEESQP